jgi:hypothetical protein
MSSQLTGSCLRAKTALTTSDPGTQKAGYLK